MLVQGASHAALHVVPVCGCTPCQARRAAANPPAHNSTLCLQAEQRTKAAVQAERGASAEPQGRDSSGDLDNRLNTDK